MKKPDKATIPLPRNHDFYEEAFGVEDRRGWESLERAFRAGGSRYDQYRGPESVFEWDEDGEENILDGRVDVSPQVRRMRAA
jgi:hypothetical protein